jgi:hypothetical protein
LTSKTISIKYPRALSLVDFVGETWQALQTYQHILVGLEVRSISGGQNLHSLVIAKFPNAPLVVVDFGYTGKLRSVYLFPDIILKEFSYSVSCAHVKPFGRRKSSA